MGRYIILILICLLTNSFGYAQTERLDSLAHEADTTADDSMKVQLYSMIATEYSRSDPNKGILYGKDALLLSEKMNWKMAMAGAYNAVGVNYKAIANYPSALEYFFKSLKLYEELKEREYIARTTSNIGQIYRQLQQYDKALQYFERSLKVNTEIDRKFGMTNNYSDMAIIYSERKEYKKSLELLNKALVTAQEDNDREGVAIVLGNIALVYDSDSNYKEAIPYYEKSIKVNEEIGRIVGVAINYNNLAKVYYHYGMDSTDRFKDIDIRISKSAAIDRAIVYYHRALAVFEQISALDMMSETNKNLAKLYQVKKDYQKALDHFTVHKALQDSILSNDDKVKLANLGEERAQLEKKQQVRLTKLTQAKRRNEAILFAVAIILLLTFVIFVVRARRRSDKLLLNILPEEVAEELKSKGNADAKYFNEVTVLFTDFVDFTVLTEKLNPQGLVNELHTCFKAFDEITSKYHIEKIKTVGDAYLAVSGLPAADKRHATNVTRAALEILDFMKRRKAAVGDKTFDIRIGVHSGSVVAGIVGVKKFAYDIWGDTVNIAARMEQNSEPGKINISAATHELVKDQFTCIYRGEIDVKNKGGLAMYYVEGPKS